MQQFQSSDAQKPRNLAVGGLALANGQPNTHPGALQGISNSFVQSGNASIRARGIKNKLNLGKVNNLTSGTPVTQSLISNVPTFTNKVAPNAGGMQTMVSGSPEGGSIQDSVVRPASLDANNQRIQEVNANAVQFTAEENAKIKAQNTINALHVARPNKDGTTTRDALNNPENTLSNDLHQLSNFFGRSNGLVQSQPQSQPKYMQEYAAIQQRIADERAAAGPNAFQRYFR